MEFEIIMQKPELKDHFDDDYILSSKEMHKINSKKLIKDMDIVCKFIYKLLFYGSQTVSYVNSFWPSLSIFT